MRGLFASLCLILAWVSLVADGRAHPGHMTAIEAEWKEAGKPGEPGRLEVALRIPLRELELALSSGREKRVRYGHTLNFEKLLSEYVQKRCFVYRASADLKPVETRAKCRWVGMERDKDDGGTSLWCYFELAVPDRDAGKGKWMWRNRLFVEMFQDQANSVRLQDGDKLLARDFGVKVDTLQVFGD